ncbi:MAG: 2-oxoacid:acceptor oxidoreductase family protein [Deferrisomatales bacterium]
MRDTVQISLCGFGGQGILLIGGLLGEAAIREGYWAAGANSYGAQARGSGCRAEVVISREPADYPHVVAADLLVAMAPEAYTLYLKGLSPQGLVIVDHPGVAPAPGDPRVHLPVGATAAAVDRFGNRQAANIVMLAATVAITGLVGRGALTAAVAEGVDARFRDANRKALEAGFALGDEARAAAGPLLTPWLARLGLGRED